MRVFRGAAWLTLATVLLALTGLPPARAGSPPRVVVKIGLAQRITNAPFIIAIEEGYFVEHGIDVQQVELRDLTLAWAGLISGQVDVFAGSHAPALFEAARRGAKIRLVADKGHNGPGDRANAFMVRQDLIDSGRFKTFRDLRGMRIPGGVPGTLQDLLMERMLKDRGFLVEADIQWVLIPFSLWADAFRARTMDAAWVSEPLVTRLEDLKLARVVATSQDILPGAQYGFVMYGTNLIVRNPGLGQRVMNAYLRGVQQYNKGKTDRNVGIIARWTGDDEALVRRMAWPLVRTDGRINTESVMQVQSFWARHGLLDQVVPLEQFYDPTFARRAFRSLTSGR